MLGEEEGERGSGIFPIEDTPTDVGGAILTERLVMMGVGMGEGEGREVLKVTPLEV